MKVYGALEVAQLEWFTNAGKPAASSYIYRVIWVTDLFQVQVSDGTNWRTSVISSYTASGLPAASVANTYQLAYITDTGQLKISNGTVWISLGSVLDSYTNAGKPAAASNTNRLIIVSDLAQIQYSDGSSWINPAAAPALTVNSGLTSTTTVAIETINTCNATGGGFTINLPTAVGNGGKKVIVNKTDSSANLVTIDGNGTQTINGALTFVLSLQNDSVTLYSDGTNWQVT